MKPRWHDEQLVGYSVKSMAELERVIELGIKLVELKLEKFNEVVEERIYSLQNDVFTINSAHLKKLTAMMNKHNFEVQLHMPIERSVNSLFDTGINVAFLSHHDLAIERFNMLEKLYRNFSIGQVITMHPPTVSFDGQQFIKEEVALKNAQIFFERLDQIRMVERHQTIICLENQTDQKILSGMIGYLPIHFKSMLRNTRTFSLTVDTGHRRLAKDFSVRNFMSLGLPFVNFHFHGNHGEFREADFNDDEHAPPTPENIKGYHNYIRFFRRNRPRIILELAHLEQYSDKQLIEMVQDLQTEIN